MSRLTTRELKLLLAADPDPDPNPAIHPSPEEFYAEINFWIGYCYYHGTGGVKCNYNEAVAYLRKGCRNNRCASCLLANCFRNGHGVSKDELDYGPELFDRGRTGLERLLLRDNNKRDNNKQNDDAEALFWLGQCYGELGQCYGESDGVSRLPLDQWAAFKCYYRAAKQGHIHALYAVGLYLRDGFGAVATDWVQAAGWWGQAARQGYVRATDGLHQLFKEENDLKERLVAVAQGDLHEQATFLAASVLAYCWQRGVEGVIPVNAATARQWERKANQCTERIPPSWKPAILRELSLAGKVSGFANRLLLHAEVWVEHWREEKEPLEPSALLKHYRAANAWTLLQTIQASDAPDRQEQLVELVQDLRFCCDSNSNSNSEVRPHPQMLRVLAYCLDHGLGVDEADSEHALRLYVKADEMTKNQEGSWFGLPGTNKKETATPKTTSAEWLHQLDDARVKIYQTRFALDASLKRMDETIQQAKTSRDTGLIKLAIRYQLESTFLQGLLGLYATEGELQTKASDIDRQLEEDDDDGRPGSKSLSERLTLLADLETTRAQLKKEVEAREAAAGAAASSKDTTTVPSVSELRDWQQDWHAFGWGGVGCVQHT